MTHIFRITDFPRYAKHKRFVSLKQSSSAKLIQVLKAEGQSCYLKPGRCLPSSNCKPSLPFFPLFRFLMRYSSFERYLRHLLKILISQQNPRYRVITLNACLNSICPPALSQRQMEEFAVQRLKRCSFVSFHSFF